MKIRNGFVSNSSSSSFVIVSTKKSHDKVIAQLNQEDAIIIKNAVSFSKIGSEEVVVLAYHQYNGEYHAYCICNSNINPSLPECEGNDSYEFSEKINGILSDYELKIKDNKGCISVSFDN